MKLSKETVEILKNFATINTNLIINPGKKISTMSATKDIFAEYNGVDEFDKKVSIFNLSELLGAFSAFSDTELILEDKNLVIKQGKAQVKYVYADENVLITPKKSITMPSAEIEVNLSADLLASLQKMSAILSVEDLAIVGNGKTISVKVLDKKNPTANSFVIDLEVKSKEVFQVNFKVEKLRMIPDDYKVEISSKKISKWTASGINLVVFVAVESDSVFN